MGSYEPGERLIEATIATELDTSRGPVREALRQLEHEGLVVSYPYRGAVVLGVSDEEVQEVLIPIRLTLERFSFTKALEQMTEEDFAELGKEVWLMEQAAARGRAAAHRRGRHPLPRVRALALGPAAHDAGLAQHRAADPRVLLPLRARPTSTQIAVEHGELLAALQTRDPDVMLRRLERHITVPSPPPAATARTAEARAPQRAGGSRQEGPRMSELLTVENLRTSFHTQAA